MFHVERWQSGCYEMFHVEQSIDVKKIKIKLFTLFNKNNLVVSWKSRIFATDLEI